MKNRLLQIVALVAVLFLGVVAHGQAPTVGVVFQSEQSYDGYTLLPVTSSTNTYLVNNWEKRSTAGRVNTRRA